MHAVSEDGVLQVGSAGGSQLAPYASGARKAIWVVGAQKLVPDVATGLRRIRDYSVPKPLPPGDPTGLVGVFMQRQRSVPHLPATHGGVTPSALYRRLYVDLARVDASACRSF